MTYAAVMATPLPGNRRLGLRANGPCLSALDFLPSAFPLAAPCDDRVRSWVDALERYFSLGGDPFAELCLAPAGTPYQQRIWRLMREIEPGKTETYGGLAARAGSGARAVASACRANPIPIIVPCHRVVAAHGLGGYMGALSGDPLDLKSWLLDHEAD